MAGACTNKFVRLLELSEKRKLFFVRFELFIERERVINITTSDGEWNKNKRKKKAAAANKHTHV